MVVPCSFKYNVNDVSRATVDTLSKANPFILFFFLLILCMFSSVINCDGAYI